MLTKIGICAMLAGMVLLSEFSKDVEIRETLNAERNDIGGDYLGKLRFVELPGIVQVFSSDAKLKIGAVYKDCQLNKDDTILTVSGISSKAFSSPSDGIIKTLTHQDNSTKIELSIDGDMVICFTANGNTAVEEGQPIKTGDTLYSSIDSLKIGMTKEGRPVNPAEYFDISYQQLS